MPTNANSPITFRSTFSSVIHAWSVDPVASSKGAPELMPKKKFTSIRQVKMERRDAFGMVYILDEECAESSGILQRLSEKFVQL